MKGNINCQYRKVESIISIIGQNSTQLTVYKGSMPTSYESFNESDYTNDKLLSYTFSSNSFSQDSNKKSNMILNQFPSKVAASASGTPTWFCLRLTSHLFLLCDDISDVSGQGVLKLGEVPIVVGTQYGIFSLAFEFKQ